MKLQNISLDALEINNANDRHGELENEKAAIAWLFSTKEIHMRNLAKDIVEQNGIYEPPLVSNNGDKFVVFDGNRRVTCLKLLLNPSRAPTSILQDYFQGLRDRWDGEFPSSIQCQVEKDKDRLDSILYRRHTGTQNGIGQSNWDDRMKSTFVTRTGKGSGLNIADEIEERLSDAGLLPTKKKIPRSNLNRLLSAEPFRNRLGFSVKNKKFVFTHDQDIALRALAKVADDLANRRIVLGDIWDVEGKRAYLDRLETEGMLPTAEHSIPEGKQPKRKKTNKTSTPKTGSPSRRLTLIPDKEFDIAWSGRLQRHHAIWEELQFKLKLKDHTNAISVLFRVLLELSIDNYVDRTDVEAHDNDKLSKKFLKVGQHMRQYQAIDDQQLKVIRKFQQAEQLISADTFNRYVHSSNFTPSEQHLTSLWDSLSGLIVKCLKV